MDSLHGIFFALIRVVKIGNQINFFLLSIFLTLAVHFGASAQNVPPTMNAGNDGRLNHNFSELIKGQQPLSLNDQLTLSKDGISNFSQQQLNRYLKIYNQKQKISHSEFEKTVISKGGVDTGGGTLVRVKKGPFSYSQLIDFYNFAPDWNEFSFKKIRIPSTILPNRCDLADSYNGRILNGLFKNQIYYIMAPLEKSLSDELSPVSMNRTLISYAIDRTEFIFSETRLGPAALDKQAYLKENSDHLERLPVAVYIQGQGTIVSRPDFNEMSGQDQLGLIVHEILRQISIGYKLYLSDYDLQNITAQLILQSKNIWSVSEREFLKTHLPQEIYMGPFTKYAVRALLNDICSVARVDSPKDEEGPECQNLPSVNISQIYSKIEKIRGEISDSRLCTFNCTAIDTIDLKWLTHLEMAEQRFLQNGKRYNTSKELSTLVLYERSKCQDFVEFLRTENFLK